MKISIIGAAGMIGSQVVSEAISRGHEVKAFTRSGSTVGDTASTPLDFSNTAAVTRVINDSDVTVISFAGRGNYAEVINAHHDLIEAHPHGRILVVGGAGALKVGDQLLLQTTGFPAEYLREARTFAAVYQEYLDSENLDWTMIAPSPEIAPGTRTGSYVSELDTPAGGFISTQDFAAALIDEIEEPAHRGQRFTVASADETAARG